MPRATVGRPFGVYVHGNNDTDGAVRAIEMITTGLRWQPAQAPVTVIGEPEPRHLDACWELGAAAGRGADALTWSNR